jgi:heat shock protein HslJ
MMACPDRISRQEFEFLQALGTVRLFQRDGLTLLLSDAEGEVVLRLDQRDAD